ncbi:unnamed protein product [Brachionus calyciflorus]|uniref:Uncharacterized protein n=1 Tax=Brachionus calyciflorus TaxID=104777 RepID=A0A814MJM4_9BILA|nr:unnamed protein product [Brachionus calyciflorus]
MALRKGQFYSVQNINSNNEDQSDENVKKHLSNFEIPLNNNFLQIANNELNQFKGFLNRLLQMNQSALTNKISFAENLAFRLLGTIDWHKANFDELKQFIEPFLNTNYLNLNHLIFKENGKFLHLKQNEAHEAIHTWAGFRTKMNCLLVENPNVFNLSDLEEKKERSLFFRHKNKKIEGHFESLLNLNSIEERVKEIMILYLIAKWSKDDSSLKFSTFFHYGIPRARVRHSTLIDTSILMSENIKDVSAASSGDSSGNFSHLSSPSSASSKLADHDIDHKPPVVKYYSRPHTRQVRRLNRSSSFLNALNSSSEKETPEIEKKNTSAQGAKRDDLKYVNGGIIAHGNVYFPMSKK